MYVQVDTSGEETKSGVPPEEVTGNSNYLLDVF